MRRSDYFGARLQAERAQGDVNGICAIGAGNTMLDTKRRRPCLFERIYMRPANEGRLRDHFGNGGVDLRLDAQVLSMQIYKGYFHEWLLLSRKVETAQETRWVASVNPWLSNILSDDRAGANHDPIANPDRQKSHVGSYADMVTQGSRPP